MIILLIKKFPAKIKHLQNMKISSKFEGKSECPHYTQVKHYDYSIMEDWVNFFVTMIYDTKSLLREYNSQLFLQTLQSQQFIKETKRNQ